MKRLAPWLAGLAALAAQPAWAQDHSGHTMPPKAPAPAPAPTTTHDHSAMQANPPKDPHAGHDMSAMLPAAPSPATATGTDLPAGNGPAPSPPMDHYADRQFPLADMAEARRVMMKHEGGGQTFSVLMIDLAEYRARQGRDGYAWDAEAWFGGDINRLAIRTEGEGVVKQGLESAEVQALYSRAIGPYFNLQAGMRQDFQPKPTRTYAVIGFEGLAPYWFEIEGSAFLSDKGDLFGRIGGYYDQRLTQRLILQPRAELNFSAQDVRQSELGAGLTSAELGLRLRYEFTRQFAPYLGVSYEAKTGRTARYARADGEDPTSTSLVAGLRIWF